jgi:hypothetical protein
MNINGYSVDNTHDGNTTIQGNLVVLGNIFDDAGSVGIPEVKVENHSNLDMYVGSTATKIGVLCQVGLMVNYQPQAIMFLQLPLMFLLAIPSTQ